MTPDADTPQPDLSRRHLAVGWVALLVFLLGGLALEAMHGLKIDAYLGVDNETRRLLWTLAHAHGTLLGLVNIAFAWTLTRTPALAAKPLASRCLVGATVLMPAGFFLGGVVTYGGDPSVGILLLPVGALLLVVAVAVTVRATLAKD